MKARNREGADQIVILDRYDQAQLMDINYTGTNYHVFHSLVVSVQFLQGHLDNRLN